MASKPQEGREQLRKKLINLVGLSLLFATGCRYTPTSKMESIDSSTINLDGSSRVTVLRESTNAALTSPWIFVYLTKGSAAFNKKPGDRIVTDQIAFEISGAWPVRATWLDNTRLQIWCDGCGAPLAWASKKRDRVGNVEVTYADFPSVPHQLQESYQDNPGGTLRAEQFYYTLSDTPISDSTTVRIEPLPLSYDKKLERINGHWPEDVLELAKTRPLFLRWSNDKTLVVLCDKCGRKLSDASNKLDSVYGVHVRFEGFVP
jgi:hypothetical protein